MAPSDQSLFELRRVLDDRETWLLAPHACFSRQAVRRRPEDRIDTGHRQHFAVDTDRILHSLAYTRYIDKTQVFSLVKHDHITHRVLHVQFVSRISRTIGRFLGLNEDLIEAIALGHDIGHCPFGHDGETYLSELTEAAGIGPFRHNVQSVRFLDRIERKGRGCNLTLQTLDGILCHDGEIHADALTPVSGKTFERFDKEVAAKTADPALPLTPLTLEACVVRMADTISYIGRDIEDAIRLNLISREEIPSGPAKRLGVTNGTIVYALVTDLIRNSHGTAPPAVAFSPEVSAALRDLRRFNYEHIYLNPKIKRYSKEIRHLFKLLFERYMADLGQGNSEPIIFADFLSGMSPDYVAQTPRAQVVADFISGMTDQYFLRQCPDEARPEMIPVPFRNHTVSTHDP